MTDSADNERPKATPSDNSAWLFHREKCEGTLSLAEDSLGITCDIRCDRTGEIHVDIHPIELNGSSKWLFVAAHERGEYFTQFKLDVRTLDGEAITSDRLFFLRVATPFDNQRHYLDLHGKTSTLTVKMSGVKAAGPESVLILEYVTNGMQGFGNVSRAVPQGTVFVGGSWKVENFDELFGHVAFRRSGAPPDIDTWIAECDDLTSQILPVFSLALGRWVSWSIRQFRIGESWHSIQFRGTSPTGPPMEPTFSYLNLDPVLDLALSFTKEIDEKTGVGSAIEWLSMQSLYRESRILNACTALEHLAMKGDADGGLMPRPAFKVIRRRLNEVLHTPELRSAVDSALESSEGDASKRAARVNDALSVVSAKLGGLNQRGLRDKVYDLVDRTGLDLSDIDPPLHELVNVRNAITHSGTTRDNEFSVDRVERALREVLRRLVLALLGYRGKYESWWPRNEYRDIKFRPEYNEGTAVKSSTAHE